MFLESLIPQNLTDPVENTVYIVATLGIVLLTYSIFVEAEHRRDLLRIVGAGGLAVYAMYIGNLIFLLTMGGIFVASLIEFIEIYLGLHHHNREDLEQYKKYAFLGKKKK